MVAGQKKAAREAIFDKAKEKNSRVIDAHERLELQHTKFSLEGQYFIVKGSVKNKIQVLNPNEELQIENSFYLTRRSSVGKLKYGFMCHFRNEKTRLSDWD